MHPLQNKLEEKIRRLAKAQERRVAAEIEVAVVEAEIAAYKEAISYILSPVANEQQENRNRSSLNQMWSLILKALYNSGHNEFDYIDIDSSAKTLGYILPPGTLRVAAMNSVKDGTLVRVRGGVFKFSESGVKDFQEADLEELLTAPIPTQHSTDNL
jgi:hypothetical protein